MKEEKKPSRKPLIFYYFIALIVWLLFNSILAPGLFGTKVQEVTYNFLLEQVAAGHVTQVVMENDRYLFTALDENGKERLYKTGLWPDYSELTEQLKEAGVKFGGTIPAKNNSLLTSILGGILSLLPLLLLGFFMSSMLKKRMGDSMGNVMSFGKSNAKIYVEAQTGKTFLDVAGQDEAKEALTEIVDFLHNPQKYAAQGSAPGRPSRHRQNAAGQGGSRGSPGSLLLHLRL